MATAIPDVQSAWVAVSRGNPDKALSFEESWPVSKDLSDGEVLVKVQAAALNPVGHKLLGILPNFIAGRPHVAEFDLSGVIVASKDEHFQVGDPAYGWVPSTVPRKTDQGALAQYTRVSADTLVHRPPNVTPIQASGLTLAGLTAYDIIVNTANVQSGQSVFVNGGSTAVGAFAIQLAKALGARVVASASAPKERFVREMGADEFVDYTEVDLAKHLSQAYSTSKFDYIVEAVGISDPSLYTWSDLYLSPQGMFVSVGPQPKGLYPSELWNITKTSLAIFWPKFLGGNKAAFKSVLLVNNHADAVAFQRYVANGSVKPIVDSVFEFKDTLKAFERIMSGRAAGKVVVKIDPSVD